ncbi:MAG: 50S ribosomal protein L3 [Candidatus Eisenbacteria bacterium]|nr:50S ribosomal protein L3 [Candidatus Eisenbacteria bacterium]
MQGLIGRKIGMTQVFEEDGRAVPVTVLEAGPCPVVCVRTAEKDGYAAWQLAFDEVPEKVAARKLNRPQLGHLKKHGIAPHRVLREIRTETPVDPGQVLDVSIFSVGDRVDVIGTTKGRGFQGVVKRHGFSGGPKTHGSKTGKIPGSIGMSAYPARVIKGKKLPGQMGNQRHTIRNLKIVRIDRDRNLLLVRGAVPGARHTLVLVQKRDAGPLPAAETAEQSEKKG